jgi:prepilin-type N-terminal cleavage/methylation domain-containing protein
MKLTTRGFTLVELMIVIAIIGILAAALFPSLTSYLAKGRDTARASNIKEIVTALSTYLVDKSGVAPTPAGGVSTCADHATTLQSYLPKFPKDPIATRTHGACTTAGMYGYGTGLVNNQPSIGISAQFESVNGGHTWSVSSYQWAGAPLGAVDTFTKGSGSGYVVRD